MGVLSYEQYRNDRAPLSGEQTIDTMIKCGKRVAVCNSRLSPFTSDEITSATSGRVVSRCYTFVYNFIIAYRINMNNRNNNLLWRSGIYFWRKERQHIYGWYSALNHFFLFSLKSFL